MKDREAPLTGTTSIDKNGDAVRTAGDPAGQGRPVRGRKIARKRASLIAALQGPSQARPLVLLQQLANGVMLGSTYALVAIGYALVFGVLRVLHLAHGEVYMIGAFVGVQAVLWLSVGPFVALIGGLIGAAVLGMVLELVAFRPIRKRRGSFLAPIVSSIGAGLVLQEVMTKMFGSEQIGFPEQFSSHVYRSRLCLGERRATVHPGRGVRRHGGPAPVRHPHPLRHGDARDGREPAGRERSSASTSTT